MEKSSLSHDGDKSHNNLDSGSQRGGWVTFSFFTGALIGLTLAIGAWLANLIVFLIEELHVGSIEAVQITNIVNGCTGFLPVIGAIIADSFIGSFLVISISSCFSLLGLVLLTLTVTVDSLRPQPCVSGSESCEPASQLQYGVVYTALALGCIAFGGTRFTMATMGANQYDKQTGSAIFFNWFFFTLYSTAIVALTAIVYIQENVGWKWGFGIGLIGNLIGLAIFVCGVPFYRLNKPKGSPFTGLARVVVASIRKRNLQLSSESKDYCYVDQDQGITATGSTTATPSQSFRFLNRAAQIVEGDITQNGSIAKPWRVCRVQQVEDFKSLVRLTPLLSTSILLSTPIGVLTTLTILQALAMDRRLGPHFTIPASSVTVINLFSAAIALGVIDPFLCPAWQRLTGKFPTPLQRIGLGHVLSVLSLAVSAVVESQRLNMNEPEQMQALWLFPQLILVGIGEALHFPGHVSLYYQEFPASLKSTATAMIALVIGTAFYLTTAVIDLVQRSTRWLPDDINNGRVDNVYWMLVVIGVVNFGYFLVCAKMYKYQNVEGMDGTRGS